MLRVGTKDLAKLPLDHHAGFILSLIDGSSTLDDIVDASGLPTDDVLRIIGELIAKAIIGLR